MYFYQIYFLFLSRLVDERNDVKKSWKRSNPSLHSPSSAKSFDIQVANWRMESIVRESESGSEDEFFDCQGKMLTAIMRIIYIYIPRAWP